jgi:hypothetical protein
MMTKVIPEPERAVKRDGRSDATNLQHPLIALFEIESLWPGLEGL